MTGYGGLLNLQAQRHWTVFVLDFDLPQSDFERLRTQIEGAPTTPVVVRIDDGLTSALQELKNAGVSTQEDYLSFHTILSRHSSLGLLEKLYESFPRRDVVRIDLPLTETGFKPVFASRLIEIITDADYLEQERIADRFYHLLARSEPYRVVVHSAGETLTIEDCQGWFDLAGPLIEGQMRTIPGGEVSYTGDRINGTFTVDGAILASPETMDVAEEAVRLGQLSGELQAHPVRFDVANGRVERVSSTGAAAAAINALFQDERYRNVTEIGISFNRACREFIHDWPASSNESRPGVHIGIGADPDREGEPGDLSRPLIHLDLMAANCEVFVNGVPFLRASS